MLLDDPINKLPNTASSTIKKFQAVGINKIWDLFNYFPSRYQNYPKPQTIAMIFEKINQYDNQILLPNQDKQSFLVTVSGKINSSNNLYTKRGLTIQKCLIADDTGSAELVWYNQRFLLSILKPGLKIQVSGRPKLLGKTLSIQVLDYDILTSDSTNTLHTSQLVPVYPEKKNISTRLIREKIKIVSKLCGQSIPEMLPADIIKTNHLLDSYNAYKQIHTPETLSQVERAKRRLSIDELVIFLYATNSIKKNWEKEIIAQPLVLTKQIKLLLNKFINNLPFSLTVDQQNATKEIINDMNVKIPMNRLLLGEVGSGKTVVAAIASYFAFLNGFQSLFMAPTEILAQQHYATLSSLFNNILNINLITSSTKKKIFDGDILVGTHSLLYNIAGKNKVGFVAVDEQHKFGVSQRAALKDKALLPHLLSMTATPIPRTVLLTLYGYLKTSTITKLPKNRKPIKTYVVTPEKREPAYQWIAKEITQNKSQVFIVCPLIEESIYESMKDIRSAKLEYERIRNSIYPQFKVALLHGKLTSSEKQSIMTDFGKEKIDILVTTPVVEVGIDFPNTTIIVIEAAERFGLAQLHQLRGRVGRGDKQSYCLVFTEKKTETITERLRYFSKQSQGFKLAEYDLKTRGAGEIFGTRQHGSTEFKIADIADIDQVSQAQKIVDYLQEQHLQIHPYLKEKINDLTKNLVSPD